MKKLISKLLMSFLLFLGSSTLAKDYVIALSPYIEASEAKAQAIAVLQFLSGLEPNDKALVIDGYRLNTLGIFIVPSDPRYSSVKARLNKNGKVASALMRFAKSSELPSDINASLVKGALRLPQLLQQVGKNHSRDGTVELIILGSPLYSDLVDISFSMSGGVFPSDSHIKESRSETPYGTSDYPHLLKDFRIHFGYESQQLAHDRFRFYVERFWTLYSEVLGAKVISFTGDTATLFENAKNNISAPEHNYKLSGDDKLEMIRLRSISIDQSIYEQPISQFTLPKEAVNHAHNVVIGLSWDCASCDLDLHVQPWDGAEGLSYKTTKTEHGVFFKDYRSSPQSISAHETVALNSSVDLNQLRIAVNFYSGHTSGGVRGEIRLAVNGLTYANTFSLAALDGNQGTDVEAVLSSGASNSVYTTLIDPLLIVGLL